MLLLIFIHCIYITNINKIIVPEIHDLSGVIFLFLFILFFLLSLMHHRYYADSYDYTTQCDVGIGQNNRDDVLGLR